MFIFNSHFPVTTHGQDLVSVTYLNKFTDLWCSLVENISKRYPGLDAFHT